ncbi:MAG: hypothetical protein R6V56_08945 [Lentisphaeria bacterium]
MPIYMNWLENKLTSRSAYLALSVFFCCGIVYDSFCADKTTGQRAEFTLDTQGRITGAEAKGKRLEFESGISVFGEHWDPFYTLNNARLLKTDDVAGRSSWNGVIDLENQQQCRYWTMIHRTPGQAYQKLGLEAVSDLNIEGAYFHLKLPVKSAVDGEVLLYEEGSDEVERLILPREQRPETHILGTAVSRKITVRFPSSLLALNIRLNSPCQVQLQDNRKWHSQYYVLMFKLVGRGMKKGQSEMLGLSYQFSGEADRSAVQLQIGDKIKGARFEGVGGNYCFQIDSPQTNKNLQEFPAAWARTEMSLSEWEPENDNGDSSIAHWEYYKNNDKAGSNLRRELELAKRLQEQGTKLIMSIWDLPEWLYEKQGMKPYTPGRRVPEEMWPEVFEAVATYLKHARDNYGVEPSLISFNEPDLGVCVKLSAEKYHAVMQRLAKALAAEGIKTQLLLGDVSNPRHGLNYVKNALDTVDDLSIYGAVGFHSWGGGTAQQYGAWRELADTLQLPLTVSEAGVDPQAWRTRTYHSWYYALRQLEMYQKILLYSRPATVLEWEFTADYPLLTVIQDTEKLKPTKRYWFLKHFTTFMESPAAQLATESSSPEVLITAFRCPGGDADEEEKLVIHIANTAASRKIQLSGLPPGLTSFTGYLTTRDRSFEKQAPLAVRRGKLQYKLPAQSLLTLTAPVSQLGL